MRKDLCPRHDFGEAWLQPNPDPPSTMIANKFAISLRVPICPKAYLTSVGSYLFIDIPSGAQSHAATAELHD
ncbi:MAG TPA: hypothetical protein PKD20_03405 [Candidatus Saccharibacteria bacterium]|nr:hypothetical protein [Candidatus Saccharibacteria bacterium]HMT55898.1 hypothetical protein [Candidatus Saccharibacteria bacterium]